MYTRSRSGLPFGTLALALLVSVGGCGKKGTSTQNHDMATADMSNDMSTSGDLAGADLLSSGDLLMSLPDMAVCTPEQCAAIGQVCSQVFGTCVGCQSNADCTTANPATATPICNESDICVACSSDSDCAPGVCLTTGACTTATAACVGVTEGQPCNGVAAGSSDVCCGGTCGGGNCCNDAKPQCTGGTPNCNLGTGNYGPVRRGELPTGDRRRDAVRRPHPVAVTVSVRDAACRAQRARQAERHHHHHRQQQHHRIHRGVPDTQRYSRSQNLPGQWSHHHRRCQHQLVGVADRYPP